MSACAGMQSIRAGNASAARNAVLNGESRGNVCDGTRMDISPWPMD